MNKIEFTFDNNITVLSGNDFGRDIFESQMKDKFNMETVNKLVFSNKIEMICSSFVQGLFSDFLDKYTPAEIIERIVIDNPDHYDDIKEGLND